MINKYEDIINMKRPESKKYPRMSIEARSAQFAPFQALTGYEDEVKETTRLTQKKIELNNDQKLNISNKITICQKDKKEAIFTYFVFDKRKEGGKYINKKGIIKNINIVKQKIILLDKTEIPILDLINIEILN